MVAVAGGDRGLLERQSELDALEACVQRVREGSGSFLLIESPAGTGKTTLLAELRRIAEREGVEVAAARAVLLDSTVSLAVIRRILSSLRRAPALRDAIEELESAEGSAEALVEGGAAFVNSILEAIAEVARGGPLVIMVDDAHWADPVTLSLMAQLAERSLEVPAVVAVAVRTGEAPEAAIARLRAPPHALRLRPGELSTVATAELIRSRVAGADQQFAAACHEATAGNPFLLTELLEDFLASGLTPDASAAGRIKGLVPQAVIDGILVRLARLPDPAADLARAVAVLGDGAHLRLAAGLAGATAGEAAEAADRLIRTSILEGDDPLSFRHPLMAAAVRSDIGTFRRAALHRKAADMLYEEGDLERAAAHLLHATPVGDDEVTGRLRKAARLASARGDAAAAVRLLSRALEEPPSSCDRPEVMLELARAQTAAGEVGALDSLEGALALVDDPFRRAEALTDLARLYHVCQDFGTAAALAERAMAEVDTDDPRHARALATWFLAAGLHPDTFSAVFARTAELGAQHFSGNTPTDPELLAVLSLTFVATFGDPDDTAELARRAIAGHLEAPPDGPSLAVDYAGGPLLYTGRLKELERLATRGVEGARRRGSILAAASSAVWRGEARLRLGDLEGAEADAEVGVRPKRYGWDNYGPHAAGLLARVRLEKADLSGARAAIDLAADTTIPHPLFQHSESLVLMAEGDLEAAFELLHVTGDQMDRLWKSDTPVVVAWRSLAAVAALGIGDREKARELAETELEMARRARVPASVAFALRALGLAEGGGREVELLREALEILEGTEHVLETVRMRIDLGSALRRAGERRAARAELAKARDLAERLGARALAERAASEQQASGARPRRSMVLGVESLTPSERRIAERAAAGATNKQIAADLFLAPKTVEWHLGNVFRKLSISSRDDLAAALGGGGSSDR